METRKSWPHDLAKEGQIEWGTGKFAQFGKRVKATAKRLSKVGLLGDGGPLLNQQWPAIPQQSDLGQPLCRCLDSLAELRNLPVPHSIWRFFAQVVWPALPGLHQRIHSFFRP